MSGQISISDTAQLLTDLTGLVNGQEPKLTSAQRIGETPNGLYALALAISHLDENFDKLIEATERFLMQTFSDFYDADQYLKGQISQIGAGLNGATSANQKAPSLNGMAFGEYDQPETIWYGTDADPTYSAPTQSHVENIDGQEVVVSNWQDV